MNFRYCSKPFELIVHILFTSCATIAICSWKVVGSDGIFVWKSCEYLWETCVKSVWKCVNSVWKVCEKYVKNVRLFEGKTRLVERQWTLCGPCCFAWTFCVLVVNYLRKVCERIITYCEMFVKWMWKYCDCNDNIRCNVCEIWVEYMKALRIHCEMWAFCGQYCEPLVDCELRCFFFTLIAHEQNSLWTQCSQLWSL